MSSSMPPPLNSASNNASVKKKGIGCWIIGAVVAVVGLLILAVAIIIPITGRAMTLSKVAKTTSHLKTVATLVMIYESEYGVMPNSNTEWLEEHEYPAVSSSNDLFEQLLLGDVLTPDSAVLFGVGDEKMLMGEEGTFLPVGANAYAYAEGTEGSGDSTAYITLGFDEDGLVSDAEILGGKTLVLQRNAAVIEYDTDGEGRLSAEAEAALVLPVGAGIEEVGSSVEPRWWQPE